MHDSSYNKLESRFRTKCQVSLKVWTFEGFCNFFDQWFRDNYATDKSSIFEPVSHLHIA